MAVIVDRRVALWAAVTAACSPPHPTPSSQGAGAGRAPAVVEDPAAADPTEAPTCERVAGGVERCDRRDDDCDGETDEGFDLGQDCALGVGECRRTGVRICGADGSTVSCSAVPVAPQSEWCNGRDDDCDGDTDESFDLGEPCEGRWGACRRPGVVTCGEDGVARCTTPTGAPTVERCDAVDNDCDGLTDEGFGVGQACSAGDGMCERRGTTGCGEDGSSVGCTALPGDPADGEACDGLDDDCDGAVDEDFDVGRRCEIGVGSCARDGVRVCGQDLTGAVCLGTPGQPLPEVCNGRDDDCDGEVDEALGVGAPCEAGVGACRRAGVHRCSPEGGSVCDAAEIGRAHV